MLRQIIHTTDQGIHAFFKEAEHTNLEVCKMQTSLNNVSHALGQI